MHKNPQGKYIGYGMLMDGFVIDLDSQEIGETFKYNISFVSAYNPHHVTRQGTVVAIVALQSPKTSLVEITQNGKCIKTLHTLNKI